MSAVVYSVGDAFGEFAVDGVDLDRGGGAAVDGEGAGGHTKTRRVIG